MKYFCKINIPWLWLIWFLLGLVIGYLICSHFHPEGGGGCPAPVVHCPDQPDISLSCPQQEPPVINLACPEPVVNVECKNGNKDWGDLCL